MRAKVLIQNGIIETVLVDKEAANVEIEVIEYDDNFDNASEVESYMDELKNNPEFVESENYTLTLPKDDE
jgi:hypothetical protein